MVFAVMGLTAAFFLLLGFFSLRVRVGSGVFRALKRGVCALWALVFLSLVPGTSLGVNALNILALSALGVPGAVLLQVIAWMP